MSKYKILNENEILQGLQKLNGWNFLDDYLVVRYDFPTFLSAIEFMKKCAVHADTIDHHPEWSNLYKTVIVKLNTHDVGGKVTDVDIQLARLIDKEFNYA